MTTNLPDEHKIVNKDPIPFSHLESWMHKRIPIPKETKEQMMQRYNDQHKTEKVIASVVSRIIKMLHLHNSPLMLPIYRLITRLLYVFYRIKNRMELRGWENIPRKGGIFIVNHIAGQDVVIPFLAAFREPIGVFTSMGNGYFADFMEENLYFVCRRGMNNIMIEKMIRTIYLKNRYFVMWPEGTLERHGRVIQGFSGIVKVYATLNSKRDLIPFVPVYMTEAGPKDKIIFKCFKPLFIPREWLKKPEEGGKTPREIIDYLMMIHARVKKQDKLDKNWALEHRRENTNKPWYEN